MFKIRGIDQKEYGPVSVEALKQWMAEGRVAAQTPVQAEGSDEWRPLSSFPELSSLAGPGGPAAASAATARPPGLPSRPVQTSGLAVASLVLGVLGCLGIPALVGAVLGIVALVKIKSSQGRLKGQGLAIAGICLAALMLFVVIPVGLGLTLPLVQRARMGPMMAPPVRGRPMPPGGGARPMPPGVGVRPNAPISESRGSPQASGCANRLTQICLGVRIYTMDHQDTLPPAATWCDAIAQSIGNNPRVLLCPVDRSGERCSFAFNSHLDGLQVDKVDPRTVMLFECKGGWNVKGGSEDMITHHGNTYVVGFVDGTVQQIPASQLSTLRWEP
jgi:hypothetical protein